MAVCEPCSRDVHEECEGCMPDLDREGSYVRACQCFHDPALLERRGKTLRLLNQAVERFGSDDEAGMLYAVRRILNLYDAQARGSRLRLVREG